MKKSRILSAIAAAAIAATTFVSMAVPASAADSYHAYDEYNRIVNEMITKCNEYDPEGLCLAWCEEEAKIRCALEDQVR